MYELLGGSKKSRVQKIRISLYYGKLRGVYSYKIRIKNDFNCVLQEGDTEIAAKMQNLALAEGALPRHLHTAMYTQSTDNRLLTNR